uniref:COesterase domain-containing protein n=1 Tax=Globodera pallida TaxID=36090 RepID=A0A183CF31_GLOPA
MPNSFLQLFQTFVRKANSHTICLLVNRIDQSGSFQGFGYHYDDASEDEDAMPPSKCPGAAGFGRAPEAPRPTTTTITGRRQLTTTTSCSGKISQLKMQSGLADKYPALLFMPPERCSVTIGGGGGGGAAAAAMATITGSCGGAHLRGSEYATICAFVQEGCCGLSGGVVDGGAAGGSSSNDKLTESGKIRYLYDRNKDQTFFTACVEANIHLVVTFERRVQERENSEDESGQHPILVWVHGGSFLAGSADTGIDMEVLARNLVFRNITFVSINYRLGLFGFMSVHHSDGHVEGNFGLWDIELALEWVQRNIKQFNGDPTRVTLMGESAGAAAVSALAVSPEFMNFSEAASALFYLFYRYTNYSREQVEGAVRRIVENAFANTLTSRMTNSTVDLVANATFLRYMQDVEFAYDMPGVVARLQDLESDVEFVAPCQAEVDTYMANGVPVFVYSFDFVPRGDVVEEDRRFYAMFGERPVGVRRRDRKRKGHQLDAFHGLDHAFIFTEGYSSNFHLDPFTRRDKSMARLLTRMITNFVAAGDPSTRNFSWSASGNGTMRYASLNLPPKMVRGPVHFPTPMFWNAEVQMLSKYQLADASGRANEQAVNELTYEERVQLRAYKRAWYALWAFVFAIAVLIWLIIVCAVCHWSRRHNGRSAYDNIVVNR